MLHWQVQRSNPLNRVYLSRLQHFITVWILKFNSNHFRFNAFNSWYPINHHHSCLNVFRFFLHHRTWTFIFLFEFWGSNPWRGWFILKQFCTTFSYNHEFFNVCMPAKQSCILHRSSHPTSEHFAMRNFPSCLQSSRWNFSVKFHRQPPLARFQKTATKSQPAQINFRCAFTWPVKPLPPPPPSPLICNAAFSVKSKNSCDLFPKNKNCFAIIRCFQFHVVFSSGIFFLFSRISSRDRWTVEAVVLISVVSYSCVWWK